MNDDLSELQDYLAKIQDQIKDRSAKIFVLRNKLQQAQVSKSSSQKIFSAYELSLLQKDRKNRKSEIEFLLKQIKELEQDLQTAEERERQVQQEIDLLGGG